MDYMVGRGDTKTQLDLARPCPVCKNKPAMDWDPITCEVRLRCPYKCFANVGCRTESRMYDPVDLFYKVVDYWNQLVEEAVMKGDYYNGRTD